MEDDIEIDIINTRKKALSNKFKIDKECKNIAFIKND